MLKFFKNLFSGNIKAEVLGLNLTTFLNRMHQKGVCFYGLLPCENGLDFECPYKDYLTIKKYCKQTNLKLKIKKYGGLKFVINTLFYRAGAIVAVVFWLVFCLYFANNTCFINISSTAQIDHKNEIKSLINNNYKNLSMRELERLVMVEFSEVGACTITKNGVNINCVIYPEIKTEQSDAIVAPCDCVVLSVKLISGKQVAKVGAVLKAGDVMVEPIYDNGKLTQKAVAEINLSGWVCESEYFNSIATSFERTGATFSESTLSLFSKNLFKFKGCKFSLFDYEDKTVFVSPNNILPVAKTTRTYYELKEVSKKIDFESVKEDICARIKTQSRALVPNGASGVTEKIVINNDGDSYLVSCYQKFELIIK